MPFTKEALENAGFQPIQEHKSIVARFHAIHAYEIRGFVVNEPSLPMCDGLINGRRYEFAIGSSLNAVSCALTGSDFTKDESEWQQENGCTPPYLVVHLGPTLEYTFTGTYAKLDEAEIVTCEGFQDARSELDQWGESVLPPLLTGLSSSFFDHEHPVRFFHIDGQCYGNTADERTVINVDFCASVVGYASSQLSSDDISERLVNATSIAGLVSAPVAKYFHLAIEDDDPLKKFLYFFLAIEVHVNSEFSAIDRAKQISCLMSAPSHAPTAFQSLLVDPSERWKNLNDKFMWCVISLWPQLSDSDVRDFRQLKKTRNDIAHGRCSVPPTCSVRALERLASKILMHLR